MPSVSLSLLVMSKGGVFRKTLAAGRCVVGRAEDCDVRIEDAKASRHHAAIDIDSTVTVTDLDSRNGTLLAGKKLGANEVVPLTKGVPLTIGSTILMLQADVKESPPLPLLSAEAFATQVLAAAQNDRTFSILQIRFRRLGPITSGDTQTQTAADVVTPARRLETALRELVRPGDVLSYAGPAEYRLLLRDLSGDAAEQFATKMRASFRGYELPADVGVAVFPRDGQRLGDLARVATASLHSQDTTEPPPVRLARGALERLLPVVDRIAVGNINVLILGETGVGKEVLAHAIHARSRRATKPMLCLNCAAFSESLLESELFGHEKGAFTGATHAKMGLLESAEGGTVFLDEVGDMSASVQARLLRVLEQRQVTRLGSVKSHTIDIRIISATNRDIDAEISAGRFRQDLYFRLNGIVLTIPPLRERVDEIESLARAFADQASEEVGRRSTPSWGEEALLILRAHIWPGNVRELKNIVERAVLLLGDGEVITPDHLPLDRLVRPLTLPLPPSAAITIAPALFDDEKKRIIDALELCGGNQTRAAKQLGISRRTLVSRLNEYEIRRPRKRT